MITLSWGAASDVGRIRKNNQDSYLADGNVFAVADGMGGHVGGEIASKLAIDVFTSAYASAPEGVDVLEVVQSANSAILSKAAEEPSLSGMGTTLCLLSVAEGDDKYQLNLVNVGDSRGYLYRGNELYQLTDDHTLISEMVKSGEITRDEAVVHRARHILTRALGVDQEVEIDHWKIEPKQSDIYLLCSDGLTNELTDPEIAQILGKELSADDIAKQLVKEAVDAGGSDNVTCVVVKVESVGVGDQAGTRSRIVELPSQRKLRERLENASHVVGSESFERDKYVADNLIKRESEAKARQDRIAEVKSREESAKSRRILESDLESKLSASSVKVNPVITSGARSTELSAIPMPLPRRATEKKSRLGSLLRIFIFLVLLIVVIAFGVSAVGIYANHSYYVGIDGSNIGIYQGRPGGLLWYDPKVVDRTNVSISQVLPYHLPDLKKGVIEPSFSAALTYVHNLSSEASQASFSTAPVSTTSTTVAGASSPTTTAVSGG